MCGIAGIFKQNINSHDLSSMASDMAKAIAHRGPDAQGVWVDESLPLAIAHRRLSIQDLSESGAQPMHSKNSRFAIVFNGEIYNFKSLRDELIKAGKKFQGHSDTEVLLEGIEHWGLNKTLLKIKGMFAFALWDKHDRTLTLVRDRIGEKPLFYGVVDGAFVFASELKSIFQIQPANQLSIDKKALASYMRHGYVSAPHSIFNEVKKLEPGATISINLDDPTQLQLSKLSSTQYWRVVDSACVDKIYTQDNIQDAKTTLDTKLNNIIQEQSIADVPLGAFLSGGIDSSLVSAVLQSQSQKPIDTYTIGFHEKSFNEAEFAKDISKHIGSNHHEQYLTDDDILNLVNSLSHIYDEPFADASQLPTILVSRFAKKDLTVCLSGDGGDELFCGYNRYTQTEKVMVKVSALPLVFRKIAAKMIFSLSPSRWDSLYAVLNKLARKKGGAEFGNKLYKLIELSSCENMQSAYQYLMSYWQNPDELLINFDGESHMPAPLSLEESFLDGAMAWDQQWYLPGDNLTKTDRASMSASLELRAPLLDIELIDFAWQTDSSLKLNEGQSKWLLRKVLYDYVPQKLIERPKMGFSVPISAWINGALKDWADTLLNESVIKSQGIFNSSLVTRTLDEHRRGVRDHGKKLWTLLMFQSWYKQYVSG